MKNGTVATMICAFFMSMSVVGIAHGATELSLPGIPPSGTPFFSNDVSLKTSSLASGGYALTARETLGGDFAFHFGDRVYDVNQGSYKLTANFDASGNLDTIGSYVTVSGHFDQAALDELRVSTDPDYFYLLNAGNLFTARLDDFTFDLNSGGSSAVGFRTTDFVGWAAQFGIVESVYLFDFDPPPSNLPAFFASLGDGSMKAQAYTTVPLPPSVWLLGSVMLAFFGVGRRPMRRADAGLT